MMWGFLCVKTDLQTESHIFLIDINEMFVSTANIYPYLDFWRSWGNENVYSLVDIIVPSFGRSTVIGGLLAVVCSCGLLVLM